MCCNPPPDRAERRSRPHGERHAIAPASCRTRDHQPADRRPDDPGTSSLTSRCLSGAGPRLAWGLPSFQSWVYRRKVQTPHRFLRTAPAEGLTSGPRQVAEWRIEQTRRRGAVSTPHHSHARSEYMPTLKKSAVLITSGALAAALLHPRRIAASAQTFGFQTSTRSRSGTSPACSRANRHRSPTQARALHRSGIGSGGAADTRPNGCRANRGSNAKVNQNCLNLTMPICRAADRRRTRRRSRVDPNHANQSWPPTTTTGGATVRAESLLPQRWPHVGGHHHPERVHPR